MKASRFFSSSPVVWLLTLALAGARVSAAREDWTVRHQPQRPHSGEGVTVAAQSGPTMSSVPPALEFQVVEAGHYIALNDPAYARGWQRVAPAKEADPKSVFRFQIPAEVQKNRRLIRYRLVDSTSGRRLYPGTNDVVPDAAWFVYDGIPAWKGAINPKGTGPEREPAVFSAETMGRVQAYHFIADRKAVEDATWFKPTNFPDEGRREYHWTGTLVSDDGTVYDGVRFRPRGGSWRHAMGKNMWKFDFPNGHKLQARDDFGRAYPEKWSKLNLGACIQQGDTGLRGEQGMLESLNFRLFNLAGVPASRTHWVQLRIVDEAEETPADQFKGDFWGLYLAVENVDGNFLREHGLRDQSLFKVEDFQPKFGHEAPGDMSEAQAQSFMNSLFRAHPTEQWWFENIDLAQYYSYRAILEAVHHYDLMAGKNYYFRHDPTTGRWTVVPWDTDLTWSNHGFGNGDEPFHQAGALRPPALRRDYQNRLREVLDLLFNADQTGALIDECAAVISDPAGGPGITEADRRHWDHHPIMYSSYVDSGKCRPGTFYTASPSGDFRGLLPVLKGYVQSRRATLAQRILGGQPEPPTPTVVADGPLKSGTPRLRFHLDGDIPAGMESRVSWRIGAVTRTNAPGFDPRAPRRYEIVPVWSGPGGSSAEIPTAGLQEGTAYRVRARLTDAQGNAGHWSEPVEFTYGR